jgi:phage tail sheath protein FI
MAQPWRMELLLSPPLIPEGSGFATPDAAAAGKWRAIFDAQIKNGALGGPDFATASYWAACVALYYPWLVIQDVADDPTYELPPACLAAGVIARRDLARGPAIAPANETLATVVGVTRPVDDATEATLYSPLPDAHGLATPAVNVIRSFPGYGVQVWGARTLSTDTWMQFLNVRRAVSSIERQCKAILDPLVFEPNTLLLWAQITQGVIGVLMPMFQSGGLRGADPSQAFYVRCDASVNTPESIAAGQVVCEVGVAVAAPSEFIVFRIGRMEGVVQVLE